MCVSQPKIPKPPPPAAPPPAAPEATLQKIEQDPALKAAQSKAGKLGTSQLKIPLNVNVP